MRLFVGIPLADSAAAELAAVESRLRSVNKGLGWEGLGWDGLRWTTPDSWHITLQFLGNAGSEQYERLTARLDEVRSPPVLVQMAGLGVFDRAGILYAGVEPSPELFTLQQRVVAATALCGFAKEERLFHPHITLARAKGHGRAHDMRGLRARIEGAPVTTRFTATEFLLYESFTGASGARYQVRTRFPLIGLRL